MIYVLVVLGFGDLKFLFYNIYDRLIEFILSFWENVSFFLKEDFFLVDIIIK